MKLIFTVFLLFFFNSNSFAQQKDKDVSFLVIDKIPVYPGCNGNNSELKKCFSLSIQKLFLQNFNPNLANQLGLAEGKYRVFIGFKITNQGNLVNVVVRAPHKKIEEEVLRVMGLAPKMVAGELKGEKVNVKYSIPFTILVEETKAQKRARKKRERNNRRNKN